MNNLTKLDTMLYFMRIASKTAGCLTATDRATLVNSGVFTDLKSINNALYQLKKKGFVAAYDGNWYMTDAGYAYSANLLDSMNAGNSNSNDVDEDAALTEENHSSQCRIASENEQLKLQVQELECQLKNAHDEIKMLSNENLKLTDNYNKLSHKYEEMKADAAKSNYAAQASHWANVANQFAKIAESFQR